MKDTLDLSHIVVNLRDCGGLPALDGRRLRHGMLYRSGNPSQARGDALRRLESLGLQTIIDLRSPRERRHRTFTLAGARTLSIPIGIAELTQKRLRGVLYKPRSEAVIMDVMVSVYRDMVDLAVAPLGAILRLLLEPQSYPVLIHCRAGKDRTGFVCAVIQMILGAAPQALIQDYLRSGVHSASAVQQTLLRFRRLTLGLIPTSNLATVYAVNPRYIQASLDRIAEGYGGLTGYLARGGFPKSGFAQLQAQLLENG
ncbi:MAG: tyrosine-protein phosphatase [Anaerolineae bacterium]|nr:tyrosine-protein phosphatase [Anaerolineae bacterium]